MANKKIIIAGGTGLVGSVLIPLLREQGHQVRILTRNPTKYNNDNYYKWDVKNSFIDPAVFPADVIINLAGENIAGGRWTSQQKKKIMASRVDSTQLLLQVASTVQKSLPQYVSASAIGYYGDRNSELLSEDASPGHEFLSKVVVQWEEAAKSWESFADKVLIYRIGIVLSEKGGALEKMIMPMKMGVANYFGSGEQYYSWIHIEDLARLISFGISENWEGIHNAVTDQSLSNKAFVKTLQDVYPGKSILVPAPEFAIKLAMGEMAQIVLDSTRVSGKKILEKGFQFKYPKLKDALRDLLN